MPEEPTDASVAKRIAERILLTHFPARPPSPAAPLAWSALSAKHTREPPVVRASPEERLRGEHVFFYAGPICYGAADASEPTAGGAAFVFTRELEGGRSGGALPFDSGALLGPGRPRLRPFHTLSKKRRWALMRAHDRPLGAWRTYFEAWLQHCYERPERYLEARGDRRADAYPDRTDPPEIHAHNGPADPEGADRRAWTWEVRTKESVPVDAAAHVLVIDAYFEEAVRRFGRRVRAVDPSGAANADAFYRESGRIQSEACLP